MRKVAGGPAFAETNSDALSAVVDDIRRRRRIIRQIQIIRTLRSQVELFATLLAANGTPVAVSKADRRVHYGFVRISSVANAAFSAAI